MRQWWSLRRQKASGRFDLHVAYAGECAILSPVGDLTRMFLPHFRKVADEALNSGARLILDLQGITSFDTEALGALLNLPKRAAYCLQEVRMLAVPPAMQRVLRQSHLDEGLFPFSETVANAVTDWEHEGLYWRVQSGKDVAVVTVNGPANYATTNQLETTCRRLTDIGKRIDLDARGVTYIDAFLLSSLYRLSRIHNSLTDPSDRVVPQLRIAGGATLRNALAREQMQNVFSTIDAPEVPHDASDMESFALEMQSMHRSGLGTQAVRAERAPMLSTS
jgi:anti-anti-sigma factor